MGYHEQGIRDDADYGTQFLNAKKSDAGVSGGDEPPPPPRPVPVPPGGGRSVGQIVMIALIVVAVVGGGIAFFALGGGGGGSDDDLISGGDGVEVGDHDRRGTTTTTEEPRRTTTTEKPATTTTSTAPSTTVATTVATTVTTAVPTTAAPACPGGSARTTLEGDYAVLPGQQFRINITGTTANQTTEAIDLTLMVAVAHTPASGGPKVTTARPDKYGQSIPAGGTLTWTATVVVESTSQPSASSTGSWAWSDAKFATCPVGTFGG
jgi:hypothetical protein